MRGIVTMFQLNNQAVIDTLILYDNNSNYHLSLPLHLIVRSEDFNLLSPVFERADCLRLLLK